MYRDQFTYSLIAIAVMQELIGDGEVRTQREADSLKVSRIGGVEFQ
jgi:hypothetical protein